MTSIMELPSVKGMRRAGPCDRSCPTIIALPTIDAHASAMYASEQRGGQRWVYHNKQGFIFGHGHRLVVYRQLSQLPKLLKYA